MFILLQDKNICVSLVKIYMLISTLFAHHFACVFPARKQTTKHKVPSFRWCETFAPPMSPVHLTAARCCQRLTTMLSLLLGSQPLGVGNSLKWTARLSSLKIGRNCPKKDMNHLNQPSTFRGFAVSFREGRSKWVFSLFFLFGIKKTKRCQFWRGSVSYCWGSWMNNAVPLKIAAFQIPVWRKYLGFAGSNYSNIV